MGNFQVNILEVVNPRAPNDDIFRGHQSTVLPFSEGNVHPEPTRGPQIASEEVQNLSIIRH